MFGTLLLTVFIVFMPAFTRVHARSQGRSPTSKQQAVFGRRTVWRSREHPLVDDRDDGHTKVAVEPLTSEEVTDFRARLAPDELVDIPFLG